MTIFLVAKDRTYRIPKRYLSMTLGVGTKATIKWCARIVVMKINII